MKKNELLLSWLREPSSVCVECSLLPHALIDALGYREIMKAQEGSCTSRDIAAPSAMGVELRVAQPTEGPAAAAEGPMAVTDLDATTTTTDIHEPVTVDARAASEMPAQINEPFNIEQEVFTDEARATSPIPPDVYEPIAIEQEVSTNNPCVADPTPAPPCEAVAAIPEVFANESRPASPMPDDFDTVRNEPVGVEADGRVPLIWNEQTPDDTELAPPSVIERAYLQLSLMRPCPAVIDETTGSSGGESTQARVAKTDNPRRQSGHKKKVAAGTSRTKSKRRQSGVPMPEATGLQIISRPTRSSTKTARARGDGMDG